ncbi:MAG TPA: hypothetical protein VGS02_16440 [Acidobacteriaceae bacterium]|nr:hypothetical protein [Acidobacteriaceae bacterium]
MSDRARMAGQVVFLTVVLAVFWLAFVANLQPHDMYVGIPALILSLAFAFFAIRNIPIRFRPTLRDVAQVWHLLWDVPTDVLRIFWVLVLDLAGRRAGSHFQAAPWKPVAATPHETALRALAVGYTTVSPNCVVIGIDRERRKIFFHQLMVSPLSRMTRNLGAGETQ